MDKKDRKRHFFARASERQLKAFPSYEKGRAPVSSPAFAARRWGVGRFLKWAAALVVIAVLAPLILLQSGVLSPWVQRTAASTLEQIVPEHLKTDIGHTKASITWPEGLAIKFEDIAIANRSDDRVLANADNVKVAFGALSLLRGKPRISAVKVDGVFADLSVADGTGFDINIADANALFDRVFGVVNEVFEKGLSKDSGATLEIAGARIALRENNYANEILIEELAIDASNDAADVQGALAIDGYAVPITGEILLGGPESGRTINIGAQNMPLPWRRLQTMFSNIEADREPDQRPEPALGTVSIELFDHPDGARDQAVIVAVPDGLSLKLDEGDFVPFDGRIQLEADFAADAFTLVPATWRIGQNEFQMSGRFRDEPGATTPNRYQFELIANDGTAFAADANERPVQFAARAGGVFSATDQTIRFDALDIRSDSGTMTGKGQMSMGGDVPAAVFTVLAENMSIAGVKQLWPAPIARPARRWALQNLGDGTVTSARFDIAEPLRRRIEGTDQRLFGDTAIDLSIENARFDVVGDIPPVRNAKGRVRAVGRVATIELESGTVFLPSGKQATTHNATLRLDLPMQEDGVVDAKLNLNLAGEAAAIGELVQFNPIEAQRFYPFEPDDLSGTVAGTVDISFKLNNGEAGPVPIWSTDFDIEAGGSTATVEGRLFEALNGNIKIDTQRAAFDLDGLVDGMPSELDVVLPFPGSVIEPKRQITLLLDTEHREKLAPGLSDILTGTTPVNVVGVDDVMRVEADLGSAVLNLPWVGWSKGAGVPASAQFDLQQADELTTLSNFALDGGSFSANGRLEADGSGLARATFSNLQLNTDDDFALDVRRTASGFSINVDGQSVDARALIRHIRAEARKTSTPGNPPRVTVEADIARVRGFHGEDLTGMKLQAVFERGTLVSFDASAMTQAGFPVTVDLDGAGSGRRIVLEALDAGAFLRFADIYTNVRGGSLDLVLNGVGPQSMAGQANLRDFRVFNEPKLAQLVSSRSGNSQSLQEAVNREIDTREVAFEIASGEMRFGPGRLDIADAVARGPLAGFRIQGQVFDSENQTNLAGTFMPAYGVNRLFGEIPILGALLGNGRDRGLIGVTFKLDGSFDSPNVTVNPLSVIAPGIFRSIFEFR